MEHTCEFEQVLCLVKTLRRMAVDCGAGADYTARKRVRFPSQTQFSLELQ